MSPMPRRTVASLIASVGLIVVLLGLSGRSVWLASSNKSVLSEIRNDVLVDNAYQSADNSLTQTELYATRFFSNPNHDDRINVDRAAAASLASLEVVRRLGDKTDRALAGDILENQVVTLRAFQRWFQALEAGAPFDEPIPVADVGQIHTQLHALSSDRQARSLASLSERIDRESTELWLALGLNGFGILLVLAFVAWLRELGRTQSVAKLELKHLRLAAHTDSLTGLGNHRAFEENLSAELANSARHGYPLSVAFIDVDEMKEINDHGGHEQGNVALATLAKILNHEVREGDRTFRIGGDEFAVILPHCDESSAVAILERVRENAEAELPTGVSVGVAMQSGDAAADTGIVQRRADAALYEAKRRGRNNVASFEGCETVSPQQYSDDQVHALRTILSTGAMGAAFQPIWNLDNSQLLGIEALARPLADSGLRGPQEAFDIAERIGKSFELDALCRATILAHAHQIPIGTRLFLNISPDTLNNVAFSVQGLVAEIWRAGLEPARVVIEVTEKSTVPMLAIAAKCALLREAGFELALDDVGSGNAGLEMMRKIPVDFIKIDRSVIVGALHHGRGRGVMMAITAFANSAGALVIAEGIEDAPMLGLVREVSAQFGMRPPRIHAVQGYLLGRPVEAAGLDSAVAGIAEKVA